MTGLRLAGILLIAWIPFAIGRYKASQLREQLGRRRQLLLLLTETSRSLRLTRRPPDEILATVAQSCDCSLLIGADQAVNCDGVVAAIRDPTVKSRVSALFHSLRTSDAVGADQAMRETIDWLTESVSEAAAVCDLKAPLFTKLGALVSLFVFILLL